MFSSLHYSAVYNNHVPVLSDYFFGEDRVVRAAVDQARARGRVASSHFVSAHHSSISCHLYP